MNEEVWEGFACEVDGVKYYKHTCIRCHERWTDHWKYNSYCSRNLECRRRRSGI